MTFKSFVDIDNRTVDINNRMAPKAAIEGRRTWYLGDRTLETLAMIAGEKPRRNREGDRRAAYFMLETYVELLVTFITARFHCLEV